MKQTIEFLIKSVDEKLETLNYRISVCNDSNYKMKLESCVKSALKEKKQLVKELNSL